MKRVSLWAVVLVLGAAGCTEDNPLPDVFADISKRLVAVEGLVAGGGAATLDEEAKARKAGDADTLQAAMDYASTAASQARAYSDGTVTAERGMRIQGDADTLASATAYVDQRMKQIPEGPTGPKGDPGPPGAAAKNAMEPHLFDDKGNDLGYSLGRGLVYLPKLDAVVDYDDNTAPVGRRSFTDANCSKGLHFESISGQRLANQLVRSTAPNPTLHKVGPARESFLVGSYEETLPGKPPQCSPANYQGTGWPATDTVIPAPMSLLLSLTVRVIPAP